MQTPLAWPAVNEVARLRSIVAGHTDTVLDVVGRIGRAAQPGDL
jgi:hypothetical protein